MFNKKRFKNIVRLLVNNFSSLFKTYSNGTVAIDFDLVTFANKKKAQSIKKKLLEKLQNSLDLSSIKSPFNEANRFMPGNAVVSGKIK